LTNKPDASFEAIFGSKPQYTSVLDSINVLSSHPKGVTVFAVHNFIINAFETAADPEQKMIAALAVIQPHNAIMWVTKALTQPLSPGMEQEAIKDVLIHKNGIAGIRWHPIPGALKKGQAEVAAAIGAAQKQETSNDQPAQDNAETPDEIEQLKKQLQKVELQNQINKANSSSSDAKLSILKDRMFTVMSQIEDFNMSNADHIPHLIDRLMRTDVLPGGVNAENLAKLQDLQQSLPNSTFKTNLGTYLSSQQNVNPQSTSGEGSPSKRIPLKKKIASKR
jgi:hypothetical protein